MRSALSTILLAALLPLALACGSDGGSESGVDAGQGADAATDDRADAGSIGCVRDARPENGQRYVVVARPYGDEGGQSSAWEVLSLSEEGALSSTGETFTMGRATDGVVHLTPDGEIGFVAQDDGTLGVFRTDADGRVTVLQEAYQADFYAAEVVLTAGGDAAYVIDSNWRENGGGIYRLRIDCDGGVQSEGLMGAGKLPRGMSPLASGDAVITASDFGESGSDLDVHLVNASFEAVSSVAVFPDREAIISALDVTASGDYALIGDGSGFSSVPNRVAIARVTDSAVEPVQVISPLLDPFAIVASPYDDGALVVSGFGDALFHLAFDSTSAEPFSNTGELSYTGSSPELPADAVLIDRGNLLGLVLIAETRGVRLVQFDGDGGIIDLGLSPIGESFGAIVGAIGVQP